MLPPSSPWWWRCSSRSSSSPCRPASRMRAALFGAVTGLFPIGWIILNVIFLYRLTVEKGWFETLQQIDRRHHAGPAPAAAADRLLLRRLLRGRGRLRHAGRGDRRDPDRARLLAARGLRPVADRQYRAGRLRRARHADPGPGRGHRASIPMLLGAMVGRQLPFFSLIVPFWLIWAFAGFRGMIQIWPAILVCGVSLRGAAVPGLELHQPLDRRHRRVAGLDGLPRRLPARSGSRRRSGLSPALRHARRRRRHADAAARRRADAQAARRAEVSCWSLDARG